MQFIRMLVWVLILAALLIFSIFNWNPVEVQIWTDLVVETRVPALVITAFLMGLIPAWLIHRGTKWRLNRKISTLESTVQTQATAHAVAQATAERMPVVDPAVRTSVQSVEMPAGPPVDRRW